MYGGKIHWCGDSGGGVGYRDNGVQGNGGERGESTSNCSCNVEGGEAGTEMGFEKKIGFVLRA